MVAILIFSKKDAHIASTVQFSFLLIYRRWHPHMCSYIVVGWGWKKPSSSLRVPMLIALLLYSTNVFPCAVSLEGEVFGFAPSMMREEEKDEASENYQEFAKSRWTKQKQLIIKMAKAPRPAPTTKPKKKPKRVRMWALVCAQSHIHEHSCINTTHDHMFKGSQSQRQLGAYVSASVSVRTVTYAWALVHKYYTRPHVQRFPIAATAGCVCER